MKLDFARRLTSRFKRGAQSVAHDERGNVLIMVAAALIPLLGLVGSGVDISRAYMAQSRLQQACDAGVLAGRRAMAAGQWNGDSEAEARKMFRFNYPQGIYGSTGIPSFVPQAVSAANVEATATSRLPTVMMHILPFGKEAFDLVVSCTAEMEIANTDVMLVFDVTGSMTTSVSGGGTRLAALKVAAKDFFTTLTNATRSGDGRLRIGMVPYNSMANVGHILLAKDKSWVSDHALISSRAPNMYYYWDSSSDRDAIKAAPTPVREDWEDLLVDSYATTSSICLSTTLRPVPAVTFASNSNTIDINDAGEVYSRSSSNATNTNSLTATQVSASGKVHKYYDYKYSWIESECRLQRRLNTVTLSRVIASPKSTAFRSYQYENRVLDVRPIKAGFTVLANGKYSNSGRISVNSGDNGVQHSGISWDGCVMERKTAPVTSGTGAPTDTLDLDVDTKPDSLSSRWTMLFPEYTYARVSSISSEVSGLSPSANTSNYPRFGSYNSAWGDCPAAAKKLTTMTEASGATFDSWLDDLEPIGGTYHDAGMVWGIRLLSKDGLFEDENTAAPNSRPIGRHIIFMTDGAMDAWSQVLGHQGYEGVDRRVSGASDTSRTNLTKRHSTRFAKLCDAAKGKNITIWVIAFATDPDDEVSECATAGKLYISKSRSELINAFNDIAGQISRLRLSQ